MVGLATLAYAYIRTRAVQWLRGPLGWAIGIILCLGGLALLVAYIRDGAADAAVAQRDLEWTKQFQSASTKAADAARARQQALDKAAEAERQKSAAQRSVEAVSARVIDLEQQLQAYKGSQPNGCGYTPEITGSLRK